MSERPFDDENGNLLVVVHDEAQHSVWPAFAAVSAGWRVVHGGADRVTCLDYLEQNWSETRLKSLRRRLKAHQA
ncbi:MbtH family protein [Mycobacterium lehmannii]|uniref:MbtH family protein n=1 Tax=Mycobacterium lehmannii TaxID=2048550 RepID=UPI000B9431EA|nr:MbtH family protein [Mycobacterium lehmannii]